MADDPAKSETPQFQAFISYSHADKRFAAWLHRRLEGWRLPDGNKLAPIFIDRAELAAGPDLPAQVREALARSAALVVVASPAARASRWVAQEIGLFREVFPDRPVFTALIEGEPETAFPLPLTEHNGQSLEPLAADFRKGQDGQRLGLLKIVAGLSGLPLDRLAQRDAQLRQRRVMAVTAGAVILSIVLGALLIAAVRARAEAERQRTEAEGMVEFMLTDLRDRLKGVGRLDIMDAVNERAMARYAKETDLSALPADMLLRRARLLHAMAEDDLSSATRTERGKAEVAEAWRITDDLLDRDSDAPDRLFAHSQSEYFAGYVAFQAKDKPGALDRWNGYLRLAGRLTALEPAKIEWRREVGYANGNMCAAHLAKPPDPKAALRHCTAARTVAQSLWESARTLGAGIDLANRLAWEADAQSGLKRHDLAVALRLRENRLMTGLLARFPDDARAQEALMRSDIGLARAQLSVGQRQAAQSTIARGKELAGRLQAHDPSNRDWSNWKRMLEELDAT